MNYQTFNAINAELRERTHIERGNGKYGGLFGTSDRAAEIFEVESFNMPDESHLFNVDIRNPQAVLREIQLAYAAGWAVGESISTALILGWVRSRDSEDTRATLADMALGSPERVGEVRLARNWHRFKCAPDLAETILRLPPVSQEEKHGRFSVSEDAETTDSTRGRDRK